VRTIKQLVESSVSNIRLDILVFGPQVTIPSGHEKTRNLQLKRIQIREELEKLGHNVKYAEDIVDPNLPSPQNNAFLQEIIIMAECDLIFNIVDSPGSITEAALIASRPTLAQKAALFMDSAYSTGLTAESCRAAEFMGAAFNMYEYPKDLQECNLLTFIVERVAKAQFVKLLG
jgi:hypothetical protein